MTFVLDASTTLAWHFGDETSDETETIARRAFGDGVAVPQHWFLEVLSGLLRGERRHRSDPGMTSAFLERLEHMAIEVHAVEPDILVSRLLPLARAHRLSAYDAAYLDLALRRGLPLATLDAALAAAGHSAGVEVLITSSAM